METKDLNSIGLAYLQMVEKRNTEAKKNHAKTLDKVDPEELEGDHEDRDDKDIDNDGDVDSSDKYLHKKRKAVKKAIKKDDDEQEKFKAYTGDDKDGQQGAAIGEDKEDKFEPHMMYDPKTGKGYNAKKKEDHLRMKKMGYTHDKPEEIDEASKEGTIRIIDLSDAHPDNRMGAKEKSGFQVQRLTKGKFVNQGKPYAKKAQAEKERNSGQSSMQFEAKNITTPNNALVSFYQKPTTSSKYRLTGHMNMRVIGSQHQMSPADTKNISNRAVKAGVGKMVKIDNSMLPKHIADYKKENKPAPPKIAVALSQHHAKSVVESTDLHEGAARQAAFHKGLMDYCKEIGKDHMDHKDFMDHAKHVKAGNWKKAKAHADDQDTEVREKIHSLAIDHLGQGAASELYGGDRELSKNESIEMSESVIIEVIDMDDATFDEFIEHMTDEELQALEEGIIGGTARLLGKAAALPFKATAGAAKMAYRGGAAVANRFSRTGRANAMDRKVDKIVQKRIAKRDKAKKIEAEKARLNTSKDRLKTVRNDKSILKVPTNPASRRPAAPAKVGTAPNFTQFESVNVNEATIPDGQTAMTKKPELTKKDKKTMGKIADLMKTANESVNVDDVLALIDQGYTLDQAEAIVAEACGGGGGAAPTSLAQSRKHPDDKKLLKASRKQSKAGDNDRNMANNQRSIPAKGADTAPVRPGTKQDQRDFDKASRMAKSKDKVSLKPMPAALAKKMKTDEELHGDQHKLDHDGDRKITGRDLEKVRKHGAVQKESVMDRVSNMVEDIRADIQEDRDQDREDSALRAGPGGKYISYFDRDNAAIKRQLELGPKGKYKNAQQEIDDHESGKKHNPAIAAMIINRNKPNPGTNVVPMKRNNVNASVDESVQEAAKPTAIHHSTPVTAAQANDVEAEGRAGDRIARRGTNMTEKEFIDIHKVPETVDPAFDGNVAAKKTAEAIKKAPKVSPTPNKNPTAGDKNIVKSTEAPAANTAVVGESYMDKYAKYIRGEI